MTSLEERDYFTDMSTLRDPYAYFEAMRAAGPIAPMHGRDDFLIVTGYQECLDILLNTDDFSSVIAVDPVAPLPYAPEGDDISAQIEASRGRSILTELMVAYDGEQHRAARSLLNGMFRPARLKENEDYMTKVADQMVRDVVAKGGCELIGEIATPYVTLVIADLLGVPGEDRQKFMDVIAAGAPAGNMDAGSGANPTGSPLEYMGAFFFGYVNDRRANPREDVLTELSTATYPDGTLPEVVEVVKAAMFLFAAGQDTSAKLLGNSMRYLTENADMQRKLRDDPKQIGAFLEEALRLEGSTKCTFRIARKTTTIGGRTIKAGTKIVIGLAAGNRDPRRWDNPGEFRFHREKINQHLAFGRGLHTCIGAPLARAEVRVILEKFFEHTTDITLSDRHGPPEARDLAYEPSYIIRGLEKLYVDFKPR